MSRNMCSKRAMHIVSKARCSVHDQVVKVESRKAPLSVVSSPCPTSSPTPSWWDNVFEAADLIKINQHSLNQAASVKRKLLFSPVVRRPVIQIHPGNITSGNLLNESSTATPIVQLEATSQIDGLISQGTVTGVIGEVSKNNNATDVELHSQLPREGDTKVTCISGCVSTRRDYEHSSSSPLSFALSKSSTHGKNKDRLYPSHLKIYEAKQALNSGKEHVTPMGSIRHARNVKPPCKANCKRCQSPRLAQTERQSINEKFWGLEDHLKQWEFILGLLDVSAPKKKFVSEGSKGEKLVSRVYFFNINGERRKVCKNMFKNTLSVCDSWIDSALSHCSGTAIRGDQRGRHSNRFKGKKKE